MISTSVLSVTQNRDELSKQLHVRRLASHQPPQSCSRSTVSRRSFLDWTLQCLALADNRGNLLCKMHCCESQNDNFRAFATSSWLAYSPKWPVGILGRPGVLATYPAWLFCGMLVCKGITQPLTLPKSQDQPTIPSLTSSVSFINFPPNPTIMLRSLIMLLLSISSSSSGHHVLVRMGWALLQKQKKHPSWLLATKVTSHPC